MVGLLIQRSLISRQGGIFMTRVCRSCRAVSAAGARYCTTCGSLLDHVVPSGRDLPAGSQPVASSRQPSSPRRQRTVTALIMIALVSGGAGVYVGLLGHRPASAEPDSAASQLPPRPGAAELAQLQQITPVVEQSARA